MGSSFKGSRLCIRTVLYLELTSTENTSLDAMYFGVPGRAYVTFWVV